MLGPRLVVLLIAGLFAGAVLTIGVPTNAAAANCTRRVNDVKVTGPALADAVTLSPEKGSEQRLKNFDGGRSIKEIKDVRLVSDKRLPDTLTPAQISFDALIARADDKLESVDFPDPTFTEPTFTNDRRHIVFTICLSAAGVSPGKYVGSIAVSGPEGLGEGRVGITANLKARWYIWLVLVLVAMALSGGALFFKDWTKDSSSITKGWWFKTVAALVVTFGVLATAYVNDPAWGAGVFQAGIALIGTALASIGGRKLIE